MTLQQIILGAIRGNITQHTRAKHEGHQDLECPICQKQVEALRREEAR